MHVHVVVSKMRAKGVVSVMYSLVSISHLQIVKPFYDVIKQQCS